MTRRPDLSRLRLLVVDDNAYVRRTVRALLHGFGVREVVEAADGAEALEEAVTHGPDVIVADWVMPILDGIELTRLLRAEHADPFVAIIMLSAHAERHRVEAARAAGVDAYLVKPISGKALHERILHVAGPRAFARTPGYFGPCRRGEAGLDPREAERRAEPGAEIIEVGGSPGRRAGRA